MRKLIYTIVTCLFLSALIPCIADNQGTSAFIFLIKPNPDEQNFQGVTRGQLLRRGIHSFFWQSISIDSLYDLIDNLEPVDTLPYSSDTPAMKWMAEGDSIIYLKYLGLPVLGQIIYYPGGVYNKYKPIELHSSYKQPEIIWIGKNYLDIGNIRYSQSDSIIQFLNSISLKHEGPEFGIE